MAVIWYVALMSNFRRVKRNSNNRWDVLPNYLLCELHLTQRKFDIRATYKQDLRSIDLETFFVVRPTKKPSLRILASFCDFIENTDTKQGILIVICGNIKTITKARIIIVWHKSFKSRSVYAFKTKKEYVLQWLYSWVLNESSRFKWLYQSPLSQY